LNVGEGLMNSILKENQTKCITFKFGPIWLSGSWEDKNVQRWYAMEAKHLEKVHLSLWVWRA